MKQVPKLTLEDARLIMAAAEKKALEIGVDMDIAIVDDGGAARKSTRDYGNVSGPGQPAFGINTAIQGRFMIFAGGLPIFVDGHPVGGIGCSSGSPDQDEEVAQAGVDALLASLDGRLTDAALRLTVGRNSLSDRYN